MEKQNQNQNQNQNLKGISLGALIAIVISGTVGAGIFDLPSTLAKASTSGVVLLAWVISGIGILSLALSLNKLVLEKPELSGLTDYAREGFGDFFGFLSGWGYWLSSWIGNIAFAIMLMSSVGYFIPNLRTGNTIPAIIFSSIISWFLFALVANGVESASVINAIVTWTKLVPLFVFIVVAVLSFKINLFTEHFWQNFSVNSGIFNFHIATFSGIVNQLKGSLMVMIWAFVGIEGASIMSSRAKKKSDAGKATIISLISLIILYLAITLLPYGYFSQSELSKMNTPALIYMFEKMVGHVGGIFISLGLIITILGAWLSWTIIPPEAASLMAEQGLFPKIFQKKNKNNAPINSLLITQILLQLFLISLFFTNEAYKFAYSLATAGFMVIYAFIGAYVIKLGIQQKQFKVILIGIIATAFQIFALFLSGMNYLLLFLTSYLLGFLLYIKAKNDNNEIIPLKDKILMLIISLLGLGILFGFIPTDI
ncbi:MAG: basic amino acid/polyamine antiporter [Lactobacillaceae bacterium]|jgi:arginine:ornithine antiporter/lysine permease|nr:basic amino acid/polyamine antiporter [Lactobacillaceae bacterium]